MYWIDSLNAPGEIKMAAHRIPADSARVPLAPFFLITPRPPCKTWSKFLCSSTDSIYYSMETSPLAWIVDISI